MIILGKLGNAPFHKALVFRKVAALDVPCRRKEAGGANLARNLFGVIVKCNLHADTAR